MRVFRMAVATALSFSVTVSFGAPAAFAAEGSGEAVAVVDAANASGQSGDRALAPGSKVFLGDTVATDAAGEAQLRFSDGTRMVVGPNSSLVIDELLFRGNATENKFSVRALGGAFRFISGATGDKGYEIRTPAATIGVRGTAFDFTVAQHAGTKLVLLEGEATLCGDGGNGKDGECQTVATPCAVLQTEDGKEVEEVAADSGRRQLIRDNFPYVASDRELDEEFRVAGHGCLDGGVATRALQHSAIPKEAIIVGTIVIVGGVVIGILGHSDSNNKTNN